MNIKKFIQERKESAKQDHDQYLASIKADRNKMLAEKAIIEKDEDIPEQTDTIETLKKYNGRQVGIKLADAYRGGHVRECDSQPLNFDESSMRVLVDGCMSVPLIGSDYVKGLIDSETLEIIYYNNHGQESIPMQKAILLGRSAGLQECETQLAHLDDRKRYIEENYQSTLKALDEIPQVVKSGEKYIYPQQQEQWEECVAYRMSDLYHGSDLKNAIEIMAALDQGQTLEQVKTLIDSGHSGNSFAMLCSVVREFSKRGVEFTKEFSDGYKYTMEHGTPEEKAKWGKCLKEVEERNAQYEAELAAGNFGKN